MAQQAKPKVMGQIEFLRIQLTVESRVVSTIPSGAALQLEVFHDPFAVFGDDVTAEVDVLLHTYLF